MGVKTYAAVASVDEVPAGKMKVVELGGRSILLCHSKDHFYAVENQCSHAYEALECGRMRHGWIACPVHGARFDLETGAPLSPPATQPIATFELRIVDGMIEVAI